MNITTDIKKSDIINFNLAVIPQLKSTYIGLLIISCFIFIFVFIELGIPSSASDWIYKLFASVIGGVAGIILGFVISMMYTLQIASSKNGMLGKHHYTISEEGLHEKTIINESMNKWIGVSRINIAGSYLYFQISDYLFHVIPKRCFDSEEQFNEFTALSKKYWHTALNKNNN